MKYLRTGLFLKPHGVKGELKLLPLTDDAERFCDMKEAYLERGGMYEPVTLERAFVYPDHVLISLSGVDSRDKAEALRGLYLCVDREHAAQLPKGHYFIADLIGCEVLDSDDKVLGTLKDILQHGAADVYVIKGDRDFMVPALKKLIKEVDINNKRIVLWKEALEEVAVYED